MNLAPTNIVLWFALLFNGALLIPVGAHLLEMQAKLSLPRDEYFAAQSLYNGWALFGLAYLGSIICLAALIYMLWGKAQQWLVILSLAGVLAALAVFFAQVYPTNVATENWTRMPENWDELRRQWESGHAISAPLIFAAFLLLCWAAATLAPPNGPSGS
jgi:hypothetical protein